MTARQDEEIKRLDYRRNPLRPLAQRVEVGAK
jgi:hypothetical protein